MSKPRPYVVGPPIENPVDFYGRQNEINCFFAHLNGTQLHPLEVVGLWRSGKTSFLKYVSHPDIIRDNAGKARQILVAYVDLQSGVAGTGDFYSLVAKSLLRVLSSCGFTVSTELELFDSKRAFDRWLARLEPTSSQWLVLLDEFDALRDRESFTTDFFRELRSYVTSGHIIWVTCSRFRLYHISHMRGREEKTSPLFNVFYPHPIVMGSLSLAEARTLVVNPAQRYGIEISDQEVDAITELGGRIPFFIQFAADKWLSITPYAKTAQEKRERVAKSLLHSLHRYFQRIWEQQLDDAQKHWLYQVAKELVPYSQAKEEAEDTVNELIQYGLLDVFGEQLRISGSVLERWVQTKSHAFEERSIAMSFAEVDAESIVPFVPVIVEATKFVFSEVSKWIDDMRKKAQTEVSMDDFGLTLPITKSRFSEIQSDQHALAAIMNESVARTQAFLVEQLHKQILQHRKNIARYETKKAEAAELGPIAYDTWIEKEANQIIQRTKQLVALLSQVYEKSEV